MRAFLPQRHQRDRADVVGVRAEEELALRVPHLAAAGLAAGEQRLEGLEVRIVGLHRAHEALRLAAPACIADEHAARSGTRRSLRAGWLRPGRLHCCASRARSRRRVNRCSLSAMTSFARATRTNSASFCSSADCFSRSTSTCRSTSEMVEPLRACGSRRRASSALVALEEIRVVLQVARRWTLLRFPWRRARELLVWS